MDDVALQGPPGQLEARARRKVLNRFKDRGNAADRKGTLIPQGDAGSRERDPYEQFRHIACAQSRWGCSFLCHNQDAEVSSWSRDSCKSLRPAAGNHSTLLELTKNFPALEQTEVEARSGVIHMHLRCVKSICQWDRRRPTKTKIFGIW